MKYVGLSILLLFITFGLRAQSRETLYNKALDLVEKSQNYQEAIEVAQQALLEAEKSGKSDTLYAATCRLMADAYNELRDYGNAEKCLNKSLVVCEAYPNAPKTLIATIYHDLGKNYMFMGKYKQASEAYNKGKYIQKQAKGEDFVYTQICSSLGTAYIYTDSFALAEIAHKEVINVREKLVGKQDSTYLSACIELANFYVRKRDIKQAELLFKQVLHTYKFSKNTNSLAHAEALFGYAAVLMTLNRLDESEELIRQVLAIKTAILGKKHNECLHAQSALAEVLFRRSKYPETDILLTNIWKLLTEKKENESYFGLEILQRMTNLFVYNGNYDAATQYAKKAVELAEKLFDKESRYLIPPLTLLSNVYLGQKKYAEAEPFIKKHSELRKQFFGSEHHEYADGLLNRANFYLHASRFNEGLRDINEALVLFEKTVGKQSYDYPYMLYTKGRLLYSMGQYDSATHYLKEAKNNCRELSKGPTIQYGSFCVALAESYAMQNRYEDVTKVCLELSEITSKETYSTFSFLSEKEKESYMNATGRYFSTSNALFLKLGTTDAGAYVFNNLLITKALLFDANKKIRSKIYSSRDTSLLNTYYKLAALKKELAQESQKQSPDKETLDLLSKNANELEKNIGRTLYQSNDFEMNTKQLRWQDIQAQLKNDEALVEIYRAKVWQKQLTDSIFYVALILKPEAKQPEIVYLPQSSYLEKEALNFYQNSIKFNSDDNASYNNFWKPIAEKIGKAKRVYFCSDGVYFQLNMLSLKNPKNQRFLREECDLQLLSSARDLINVKNKQERKKNQKDYQLFLFGYPNYSGINSDGVSGQAAEQRSTIASQEVSPIKQERFFNLATGKVSVLPGTKTEIENIQKTAQKAKIKARTYLAEEASEENIKALISPDVLHIATHGFFMPESLSKNASWNPLLRSGLLLANVEQNLDGKLNEKTENGVLTALEIVNLDFYNTDLVVLSACETGLGDIKDGEGVYGLQRAFQQSGAKSLLMSLWKVDDAATQELMSLFYDNLLLKKQSKRTAFTNAQKSLQKKYPSPYYWAAFVLVGE